MAKHSDAKHGNCFCAQLPDCHTNTDKDHRKIKHIEKLWKTAISCWTFAIESPGYHPLGQRSPRLWQNQRQDTGDNYLKQKFGTNRGSLYCQPTLNISRRFALLDPPENGKSNDPWQSSIEHLSALRHWISNAPKGIRFLSSYWPVQILWEHVAVAKLNQMSIHRFR